MENKLNSNLKRKRTAKGSNSITSNEQIQQSLIKLSLLSFTDFIEKSALEKIIHVSKLKKKVSNGGNFYASLISAIRKFHNNEITLFELRNFPNTVNIRYKNNYTKAIHFYLLLLKDYDAIILKSTTGIVEFGDVRITISSHLTFEIRGSKVIVLLYLRKDKPLSAERASKMLTLMKNGFKNSENCQFYIFDLMNERKFDGKYIDQRLIPPLRQEAVLLVRIWNRNSI